MLVPLSLEVAGRAVLCVGAGPVAASKVGPLLDAGARVTVVAPTVHPRLEGAAEVHRRPFADGDVDRSPRPRLVVAATGSTEVDEAVAAAAERLGIWCLRAQGDSAVVVPATIRRGEVLVALTTGAPALTRRLREAVEAVLDDRWGAAAAVLAELRRDGAVRTALATLDPDDRRDRWAAAVDAALDGADRATVRQQLEGTS